MIDQLRALAARLDRLESSLQRPTQEIRDSGDLRLRWGRQPDGSWTFRAQDAAGAVAGDLVEADIVGRVVWRVVGGAPTGWLIANGQQVTTDHPVLRAALLAASSPHGTASGNPLLPNLVGRFPRGATTPGGTGGADTVTLTIAQMPEHSHSLIARSGAASGSNHVVSGATNQAAANFTTSPTPVGNQGGGQAHENRPPFVDLTPLVRAY